MSLPLWIDDNQKNKRLSKIKKRSAREEQDHRHGIPATFHLLTVIGQRFAAVANRCNVVDMPEQAMPLHRQRDNIVMTTTGFPDTNAARPVDLSRVCGSVNAPWDERNDALAEAIRLSETQPVEAQIRVRRLLEQGININARVGNERTALEYAEYHEVPLGIIAMLKFASEEGKAQASTSGATPPVTISPATARLLAVEFRGSAREYFRIWAVNLCLTLLTLGIFSAWAKVRKKRYFYSHTTLDNTPFQYLGQPLPILKGRILAVLLFLIWYLSSHFFTALMPVVILAAAVLAPWIMVRSAAFNARYSAFRNMTFSFSGNYWGAIRTLYAWGLIPLILLGGYFAWYWEEPRLLGVAIALFSFYLPFWLAGIKRFIVNHTLFGTVAGELSITGGNFYFIYFKAGLIVAGLTILAGSVVFAFSKYASNSLLGYAQPFLALVPFYLAYVVAYAYSKAKTGNLVWNKTQLGPLRFQSILTGRGLVWLYLTNGLAIILSFGLLIPWAVVRSFRYRAERLRGFLEGEWSAFRGSEASSVQAAGAEVGEMFDLDFSL